MIRGRALVAYARNIARLRRLVLFLPGLALGAAIALFGARAAAGPGDFQAARGLTAAKRGDCVKAVPLLEEAEAARHRPSTAIPLADCYVALGELVHASELYRVVVGEKPQRFWLRGDYNAAKLAEKKADAVDDRIPTVHFVPAEAYEDLEIDVGDTTLADPDAETQVSPDVSVSVAARAKGCKDYEDKLVLNEREHRRVKLTLECTGSGSGSGSSSSSKKKKKKGAVDKSGATWLGAAYRGVIIPSFVMNAFAEGGTDLVVPGGAVTLTAPTGGVDVVVSLGYLSYRMSDTPFKGKGAPDTEWEFVSSDLQALTATVDLFWTFPIDDAKKASFRIGGGAGVGWTFLGDMYRTQVYPMNGKPGDPSTYLPCKGPNNPKGTFRYCNTLDKDASHYGSYTEPNWFNHGIRPLIFPWLTLPEVGLTLKATPSLAIDVDVGITLSGLLTSVGMRYAL